ncbi:hypothetical protein L7F22_033760 [Adiantum nelumboides]|nr:hypothetical protein [Adiantum nelumboides]
MQSVPYASACGSLMYAMVATRSDIAHAAGVKSRFMVNPSRLHWDAVKSIMRYLKGTKNKCLCYGKGPLELKGFCDSDMAGDVDTRKSTSGYIFTLAGGAVSWCSRLQKIVALSTTEAKYISATEASKEAIWLARLCSEFGLPDKAPMIGCDSQSAICLTKNAMFHARTKHIDVRHHFIREVLEDGLITLVKLSVAPALSLAPWASCPLTLEGFRALKQPQISKNQQPSCAEFAPVWYCKCEMPYNPDDLMVQCDACKDWFHPECLKMSSKTVKKLDHYFCPDCATQNGEKKTRKLRSKEASPQKAKVGPQAKRRRR